MAQKYQKKGGEWCKWQRNLQKNTFFMAKVLRNEGQKNKKTSI